MAPDAGKHERHIAELTAHDTIFALSSGSAPAAIAIVRISGPGAGRALAALAGHLPPERRATLRWLYAETNSPLDRAILLWLPGPETATGEDIAELQLHGGRATIAAVLDALGRLDGLRLAEPGEFTRRALIHGRIDLTQAEGLADLLAAETEGQRRAALRASEGGLRALVAGWRARTIAISAEIEAAIEFAEEHELEAEHAAVPLLAALSHDMEEALAAPPAERLRDGIRVVIAGPVNVGKSTLVNALSGRDVAIATPIAGTTRDIIEVPVTMGGVPYVLIDSAGMRATEDPVERIGVARAEAAVSGADIVLWLGSAETAPSAAKVMLVSSMCDLPTAGHGPGLRVSPHTGEGIAELRRHLGELARGLLPHEGAAALTMRQADLVRKALRCVQRAMRAGDEILIAEEIRAARTFLDAITGEGGGEQMLDALFARFCIGK